MMNPLSEQPLITSAPGWIDANRTMESSPTTSALQGRLANLTKVNGGADITAGAGHMES